MNHWIARNLALLVALATIVPSVTAQNRDDAIFADSDKSDDKPLIDEKKLADANDKLQIGGLLYLRFSSFITDGSHSDDHPFSMPNLVDVYLDARPNDRLRGFVRGRLLWNPSIDEDKPSFLAPNAKETAVQLDELWLKFDIAESVFMTMGKAHVRWGTTRIWHPVDFVNLNRRVPLTFFDDRLGIPLIKMHIPIESLGWNFYAVALMDDVDQLDKIGVAGRAEFVFSTVELGLNAVYRKGTDPRAGLDISAGVWDLDVAAEAGVTFSDNADGELDPTWQVSAGLSYAVKYSDEDVLHIGLEYFYNQSGSDRVDWVKLLYGQSQFFYIGQHYGAAYVALPAPGRWNHTSFALSAIGNFSDMSFMTRLDMSTKVLTFMTLQAYAAVRFGEPGELNLGGDALNKTEADVVNAVLYPDDPKRTLPNPVLDLGLFLRIDF
jgi:hypothetical protein